MLIHINSKNIMDHVSSIYNSVFQEQNGFHLNYAIVSNYPLSVYNKLECPKHSVSENISHVGLILYVCKKEIG